MRLPSAGVSSRAPAADGSETPTSPYRSVEGGPRWLIQVEGGEFQLVESERELAELARMGRVTGSTPVYTVADGPRPLAEVSDLVASAPRAAAVSSEPPIRLDRPRARRSSERAMLSEELAILNRPLDDEIEYYDETPVRRWPRRLAFALALAAAAFGAYLGLAPRFSGWRSSLAARFVLPARSWVAGSGPARAMASQPAVVAVGARPETPGLAAAAVVPPQAAPAAPPRGPAIEPPTEAIGSPVAEKGDVAPVAPVAEAAQPEASHQAGRSLRRHSSRSYARR